MPESASGAQREARLNIIRPHGRRVLGSLKDGGLQHAIAVKAALDVHCTAHLKVNAQVAVVASAVTELPVRVCNVNCDPLMAVTVPNISC
jgi:hypothetical protein